MINTHVWNIVTPRIKFIAAPSDEVNNYSPFEVMNGTFTGGVPGGSCTSLAVFVTAALRSVGLPARVTGVNVFTQIDVYFLVGLYNVFF